MGAIDIIAGLTLLSFPGFIGTLAWVLLIKGGISMISFE